MCADLTVSDGSWAAESGVGPVLIPSDVRDPVASSHYAQSHHKRKEALERAPLQVAGSGFACPGERQGTSDLRVMSSNPISVP